MTTPLANNPLQFVCFQPDLPVRGVHSPQKLAVHPQVRQRFNELHAPTRSRVLATPGGFDGHRAVLTGWSLGDDGLRVATGYRTYTEGLALKAAIAEIGREHLQLNTLLPPGQPDPDFAWGSSLLLVVLLPDNHVLAGQRSLLMQAAPGAWSCGFTEVLEPGDVRPEGMQPLLERLVDEELPAFNHAGPLFFVGLACLTTRYDWHLVGVLDLRLRLESAQSLVSTLSADAETVAWAAVSLRDGSDRSALPGLDLSLPRLLSERVLVQGSSPA